MPRARRRGLGRRAAPAALLLTAALTLALAACRPAAPPPRPAVEADPLTFSGAAAFEEVRRFVAVGPRVSGTPGARKAAETIAGRLNSFGLNARIDTFTDATPGGPKPFHNVTCRVTGQGGATVVLVSHFDTKAGIADTFVGANDSGSSTGLLIALAEWASSEWRGAADILFAFVDGEECLERYGPIDGLHGSRRLAAQLKTAHEPVAAVIVADMIGDRVLNVTIPRNATPWLVAMVFEVAHRQGSRRQFSWSRGQIIDDHVPFLEAGFAAVNLIDFEYGSAPGLNDIWHTPDDTLDKLSPRSLQTVGRVIIGMLNRLGDLSSMNRVHDTRRSMTKFPNPRIPKQSD